MDIASDFTTAESTVFTCRWANCAKTYTDAEILYSHLTNDHVGRKSTGNLCLTCHWDQCDVSVVKRDHITSHLRVHVPLKPHHCGVSFHYIKQIKKKIGLLFHNIILITIIFFFFSLRLLLLYSFARNHSNDLKI